MKTLCFTLLLVPAISQAQISQGMFANSPIAKFTKADWKVFGAALKEVCEMDVGAKKEWSNPDSATSGMIETYGTDEVKGLPCKKTKMAFKAKSEEKSELHYVVCKTNEGEWKIAE